MSYKQKCACCGIEMDKNYIGQHYNWETCVKNLKADNARLTAENENFRAVVQAELDFYTWYMTAVAEEIVRDVQKKRKALQELCKNVLRGE